MAKGGNLTEDGTYDYTWDAENRLIRVPPASSPVNRDKKVECKYDYMGRRVEKKVYTHSGSSWDLSTTRRFIHRGDSPSFTTGTTRTSAAAP
jgi:hypothetical protein